jgi:hypothetical protein
VQVKRLGENLPSDSRADPDRESDGTLWHCNTALRLSRPSVRRRSSAQSGLQECLASGFLAVFHFEAELIRQRQNPEKSPYNRLAG